VKVSPSEYLLAVTCCSCSGSSENCYIT